MTVELVYWMTFGPGDGSDVCEWSVDLTPEEEARFHEAIANDEPMEEALPEVLHRAYQEILEQELENMADLYEEDVDEDEVSLTVEFNEDFLDRFRPEE